MNYEYVMMALFFFLGERLYNYNIYKSNIAIMKYKVMIRIVSGKDTFGLTFLIKL